MLILAISLALIGVFMMNWLSNNYYQAQRSMVPSLLYNPIVPLMLSVLCIVIQIAALYFFWKIEGNIWKVLGWIVWIILAKESICLFYEYISGRWMIKCPTYSAAWYLLNWVIPPPIIAVLFIIYGWNKLNIIWVTLVVLTFFFIARMFLPKEALEREINKKREAFVSVFRQAGLENPDSECIKNTDKA